MWDMGFDGYGAPMNPLSDLIELAEEEDRDRPYNARRNDYAYNSGRGNRDLSAGPPPPSTAYAAPPRARQSRFSSTSRPPPPAPTEAEASAKLQGSLPPKMLEYMQKSIADCPPNLKQLNDEYLKERVAIAMRMKRMNTINWDNEPPSYTQLNGYIPNRNMIYTRLHGGPQPYPNYSQRPPMPQQPYQQQQQQPYQRTFPQYHQEVPTLGRPTYASRVNQSPTPVPAQTSSSVGGWDPVTLSWKNPPQLNQNRIPDHAIPSFLKKTVPQLSKKQKKKMKALAKKQKTLDPKMRGEILNAPGPTADEKAQRANRFAAHLGGQPKQAKRFSLKRKTMDSASSSDRLSVGGLTRKYIDSGGGSHDSYTFDNKPIKGYCQTLEKGFLRLTSAPDPAKTRPERILKRTYAMLMEKWATQAKTYMYIGDQFKSMRQDLVVQGIVNDFTVQVYESHARIALEVGDTSEFNQCMTQLMEMYDANVSFRANYDEFASYKIMYTLLTQNQRAFSSFLQFLTHEQRHQPCVAFALKLASLVHVNNYVGYVKVYHEAPKHGKYLAGLILTKVRHRALVGITQAYKPVTLPISWLSTQLGFDNEAECIKFITARNGHIADDMFVPKKSDIQHPQAEGEHAKEDFGVTHSIV